MTKENLQACHNRIIPHIHNTPVLSSRLINKMVGAQVYFKCENFQRTGAYKMRGATNAIMQLSEDQKQKSTTFPRNAEKQHKYKKSKNNKQLIEQVSLSIYCLGGKGFNV